jgi:hypothetical protein
MMETQDACSSTESLLDLSFSLDSLKLAPSSRKTRKEVSLGSSGSKRKGKDSCGSSFDVLGKAEPIVVPTFTFEKVTREPLTFVTPVKKVVESLEKISEKRCEASLSKGKRNGSLCNKKIKQDELACKIHLDKLQSLGNGENDASGKNAPNVQVCKVILTKGERKNQPCNRKVFLEQSVSKDDEDGEDLREESSSDPRNPRNPRDPRDPRNPRDPRDPPILCTVHQLVEDKKPFNPFVEKERSFRRQDNFLISELGKVDMTKLNKNLVEIVCGTRET